MHWWDGPNDWLDDGRPHILWIDRDMSVIPRPKLEETAAVLDRNRLGMSTCLPELGSIGRSPAPPKFIVFLCVKAAVYSKHVRIVFFPK